MRRKWIFSLLTVIMVALSIAGCTSSADKVSNNIGKDCEQFKCQRRIVAVNGITDKVLFSVEGRCSIEKDADLSGTLELICKQSRNAYYKHFIGISDNVTFVSTQLAPLPESEYRTKILFKPENIVPDFDLVTGQ
jgi:hypothetical protein